jgi:hypothetical protein
MLEVKIAPQPPTIELFEDYNDLFRHIVRLENWKMLAPNPDFSTMDRSFTLYSPNQVALLLAHMKEYYLPIQEAYDQGLPLLEICRGDFGLPEYVAKTPILNMDYLKKKWVLDYSTCHEIIITEKL